MYLADFGVVKMLESPSGLTATGMITGTPQYMAPEQATGRKIDHRADIYALGIVAYEMLTGRVPFSADTPVAILMKHVQEPIPLPPPALVPEPLTRALVKATAKSPDERWPTRGSLRRCARGGPPCRLRCRTVKESRTVDLTRVSVPKAVEPPRPPAPKPARSRTLGCLSFVVRLGMAAVLGVLAAVAGLIWLGREDPSTPEATAPVSIPASHQNPPDQAVAARPRERAGGDRGARAGRSAQCRDAPTGDACASDAAAPHRSGGSDRGDTSTRTHRRRPPPSRHGRPRPPCRRWCRASSSRSARTTWPRAGTPRKRSATSVPRPDAGCLR